MRNVFITAGAALVFGGLAFTGPAQAVSPLPHYDATPLVILAGDVENEEVWHDLRPDVTRPPAAVGKEEAPPEGAAMEHPKGEGEVRQHRERRGLARSGDRGNAAARRITLPG